MSKILDKIKSFELSLTSMFKEDEEDDISYLNPDTEEGKKLASEMQPFVDSINALEAKRNKEQKQREDWIRNMREGDVLESDKTFQVQDTRIKPTSVIRQDRQKADRQQNIEGQTYEERDDREK